MLKKAIALLKPHEEYFEGDHYWNFRMGYSYYYLDQEGRALAMASSLDCTSEVMVEPAAI